MSLLLVRVALAFVLYPLLDFSKVKDIQLQFTI